MNTHKINTSSNHNGIGIPLRFSKCIKYRITLFYIGLSCFFMLSCHQTDRLPQNDIARAIELPFKLSPNGHYFEKDGAPFFWLADTHWRLFAGADPRDLSAYFRIRKSNVVQVFYTMNWAKVNYRGDSAFFGKDPLQPDPAYLDAALKITQMAKDDDINICLVIGQPLKFDTYLNRIQEEDQAYAYGFTMGQAFKACSNVVWALGQDFEGVRPSLWKAVAEGVCDAYDDNFDYDGLAQWSNTLMSYHIGWESSTAVQFHDAPWLDFNMIQTSHMRQDNHSVYFWPWMGWQKTPVKPVLDAEPNYENHPIWKNNDESRFSSYDIRKAAYRSVFAGGAGISYGHNQIWPMRQNWQDSLYTEGAVQLQHLKNLILAFPYTDRIPDPDIVRSINPNDAHKIIGCRSEKGDYALIYVPTAEQDFELMLDWLGGRDYHFKWFDPQQGQYLNEKAGSMDAPEVHPYREFDRFRSPSRSLGMDWVLVIQAMAAQDPEVDA
ncbi:DUF4038 domain-containing protein [Persicobacter diffluens]|uniref:DUF4038 domain-containing protein n=1 Tax=Persicobacter diffluens TaxID=981 RepID=A0AAN4W4G9_9BACT|nr:hypothetical protein PEDI_49470 [Persicobacter diffluens]